MSYNFGFSIADRLIIDKQHTKDEKMYWKTLSTLRYRKDTLGRIFGICEAHGNKSIILGKLLNNCRDLEYILGYSEFDEKNKRVYARTNKVDLNDVEGLEGHPTAAGGVFKNEVIRKLVNDSTATLRITKCTKPKNFRGLTPSEMKKKQ